jgi:pimeloyl-ACP methyl ester carboxylesterase
MPAFSASSPGKTASCHVFLLLACLALAACATPVGVRTLEPEAANRKIAENVLSGGELSASTTQVLNRSGLTGLFEKDPAGAIAVLRGALAERPEADLRFALAELSFLHALRGGGRTYYRASSVYAFAFLFPDSGETPPDPVDPRLRLAVDLYNLGLARGFASPETGELVLRKGWHQLPTGDLTLQVKESEFRWGPYRLVRLEDASRIDVRGLRNRYRWPGIGAPTVASLEAVPGAGQRAYARVPAGLKVAATVFIRFAGIDDALKTGRFRGEVFLFTTQEDTHIDVAGRRIPIEYGLSAALAATLEGSRAYGLEIRGLLSGDIDLFPARRRADDNLFLLEPYRPGRIPVVLVHGTASSPARWAQMINELQNDRSLWGRYQFWLFAYNTGNPILYTGGILTETLRRVVRELDPDGRDAALKRMVVIGHSQGGMLARLTAVDSGTRFWDNAFSVPMEELELSPEARQLLRGAMFYEPLPFVRRLVFIATPHRGSFIAGGRIGHLAGRLISLPFRILDPLADIFERSPQATALRSIEEIPKSTDNMDPRHRFVRTFSEIPIDPDVPYHSIVAVKNPGDPQQEWNDGVVAYSSAHLEGAASELVVESGHSVQENPQAIEEVRRILREHLEVW